jgi:hypothetical protein
MPDYPSPAAKRRRIVQNIVTALSLILSVVLIIVLATAEPDSSVYQRGYDSGHATGYVEGGNDAIGPAYDRGYAAGKAKGKDIGYSAGRNKGYLEGKQYMQPRINELEKELSAYRVAERQPETGRDAMAEWLAARASEPTSTSYIANTSTGKFHRSTCSYLPDVGNRAYFYSAEAARAAGYSPCGHCNP